MALKSLISLRIRLFGWEPPPRALRPQRGVGVVPVTAFYFVHHKEIFWAIRKMRTQNTRSHLAATKGASEADGILHYGKWAFHRFRLHMSAFPNRQRDSYGKLSKMMGQPHNRFVERLGTGRRIPSLNLLVLVRLV